LYKKKTVAVVIPAYNEEKLIGRVITNMPDYVDKMVIVNDASSDKTHQIAQEYQKKDPQRIIIICHDKKKGVGGAIADGYEWCRDHDFDLAAVMAGDAQMDPNDLEYLLNPMADDEADYAKGNRLFTGDAWNKIPKIRYVGNSFLSLFTKIASGYWSIADSQCGYTVINKKVLHTIKWQKMHKRYGQPNDLLVRLNIYNFRVVDVPVRPVYNIGEKSGRIRPILIIPKMLWLVTGLFYYRMMQKYIIRDFHPLMLFYLVGLLQLLVISPILLMRLIIRWVEVGRILEVSSLTLMFMAITGLQFILFAMWFDMQYNAEINRSYHK